MRSVLVLGVLLGFATFCGSARPVMAQGINCSKARSPQEKTICGSPGLLALDHQVAVAYADAVGRQPTRGAQLRQELIAWLRQRDAACADLAGMNACLTRQLSDRLASLMPPATAAAPPAPAPAPTATAAPPNTTQTVQPQPVAPPADQAIPSASNPTAAAGRLDVATLPASEPGETLVHVTNPGRFAIAAHSPAGTALQLVDMLSGPSDIAGTAGSQDGRLDQLLDVGTYKLRVLPAEGATGSVTLTLTAFHDGAPPAALPQPGHPLTTALADGEQRSFWLVVPETISGATNVRIEAAGRALSDLRLWRNARELTDLVPAQRRIEPQSGHAMTDLLLTGHVEPGTYLATAYGGPSLPWTDNDTTQPFYLRAGASPALAEGWTGGIVGPFGSEVFAWPATRGMLRLDLPAPAPATLTVGAATAAIAHNSRAPSASITIPDTGDGLAELQAAAGQAYTLRMIAVPGLNRLTQAGSYFVTAATIGLGGDEPPPGVLLQRADPPTATPRPPAIIASTLPLIGADDGWHARFNLRGDTRLLFQSEAGGEVTVRSSGVDITTLRENSTTTDLPPGIFALRLRPRQGVQGILDLIVGKPGQAPPVQAPLPPDPAIALGVQTVTRGQRLSLIGSQGPGISVGLAARPVPVALVEGPLAVSLTAGATVSVPVQIAAGGRLAVAEIGVGDVAFGRTDGPGPGQAIVAIPASDHPRTLVLIWRRDPVALPPIPAPRPTDQTLSVQAGTPAFFDLARGEERGFTVTVPQGGLYRIETLGRLHTSGRLATPFIANLGEADANGTGQNMLIQTVLRAGRYRVDVTATDSTGHLGLSASPAPLLSGATLLPGGSVRASLAAGTGVGFPIQIGHQAPNYRINVDSLGAAWTGRLEDAEGWPLTTPGPLDGIEQALPPGQYRLVIAPDAVARKVVVRLTPLFKPVDITGHGPHDLPFGAGQTATWREPEGRDQPREPDAWHFALAGPAQMTLRLSDGMAGELHRNGNDSAPVRIVGTYKGSLEAGAYVLQATSLGRNDRLGYSVTLDSVELQPGARRDATLPATVAFAIAQPRVVSLTTFGTAPVRAELRRDDGTIVGRYGPRPDDWNIAASRLLPAGRYRLGLRAATAPKGAPVDAPGLPAYRGPPPDQTDASGDDTDDDAPSPQADAQKPQTDATQGAADASPSADSDASDDNAGKDDHPKPTVSLRLALPDSLPEATAPTTATELAGQGVHVLSLPQPAPGTLLAAQATSPASLVLALERQGRSDGASDEASGWQTVAIGEGRNPMVASPVDADPRPWRIEVWTVDGGAEPIRFAARAIAGDAQASGTVTLVPLDGMPDPLAVAHVNVGAPGPLRLSEQRDGLLAGGWPGHALAPVDGDTVMLPGGEAWLVSPTAGTLTAQPRQLPVNEAVSLSLPEGLAAPLPNGVAADGHVLLWRAESGLGQPGLGGDMGVAPASALAMGQDRIVLRNAGDAEALRLRLTRLEPTLAPAMALTEPLHIVLPPGTALPVTVPDGAKRVSFDLAPGTAGIAGWQAPHSVVAWAGGTPLTRSVAGPWTELLLVNTGTQPAPVSLAWQAEAAPAPLRPGSLVKRFFGAAGTFEAAFDAPSGARLGVAGHAGLTVIAADGTVQRGRRLTLAGPGRVIVQHGVGAMAVWIETDTQSPWPEATAQAASTPLHLVLSGPAMALALPQERPVLLHATTTSPVLIGLKQQGRTDTPALFEAGASFHRVIAAGANELRIYAPQDGPLSGSLDLSAEPIIPIQEGLGQTVSVAPGGTAVFGFALAEKSTIGVGVRADPDQATVRLLDATGTIVGQGVAQLRTLPAGQYLIEAQVAPGAPSTTLRPAVIGITPRGNGPPPDVAAGYLALVGMKLQEGTR